MRLNFFRRGNSKAAESEFQPTEEELEMIGSAVSGKNFREFRDQLIETEVLEERRGPLLDLFRKEKMKVLHQIER